MLVLRGVLAITLLASAASCRTDIPIDGPYGGDAQGGSPGTGGAGGTCGDGVINGSEECEGQNFGGVDCTAYGYVNPTGLVCEGCAIDPSGCMATCGNGVLEPDEGCDDGNNISGDGCTADCFAEEDACDTAIPVTLAPGTQSFFGELGGLPLYTPTAGASCSPGAGTGPEVVYAVGVTEQGHVTAYLPSASTNFDTILYSRASCAQQSSQLTCHDNDAGAGAGEVVSTWLEPGEMVYIFVDTAGAAVGAYELLLDLSRGGNCGDVPPVTIEGTRPVELLGRISSLSDDAQSANCNPSGTGPDAVWAFTFPNGDDYQIDLETSSFDSVAHLRSSCEDPFSEIECDSPSGSDDSSVSIAASAGQTAYFWVDSVDTQSGPYTVTITH